MAVTAAIIADRKKEIQSWIDGRKAEGQKPVPCMFDITVPARVDLNEDEMIKKVEALLDKYGIKHGHVNTLPGAWNLNRDWIETGPIDCFVEHCGVYPVNWDMHDVIEFEAMEHEGSIVVIVNRIENNEYVPNH